MEGISDGVLVALAGALFNAGMQWAMVKFLFWRIEKVEKSSEKAHERLDRLQEQHAK